MFGINIKIAPRLHVDLQQGYMPGEMYIDTAVILRYQDININLRIGGITKYQLLRPDGKPERLREGCCP